jgi:hypothetical protein
MEAMIASGSALCKGELQQLQVNGRFALNTCSLCCAC